MISIENLSKSWAEFSIKEINLDIGEQEYFVILGPTGAGKTLLLELIAGFHQPEEGLIKINNREITQLPPEEREIGFVYQDYSLFPHLTVKENMEFGLKLRGGSSKIGENTHRIMDLLGISHLADRYPRTLSGGEQQKTALARTLVLDPKVLLLDEPLSALDAPTQERMRIELKKIHRKTGVTTIHVTHNREEASLLGEEIGVMHNGQIIQVGKPDEIFRKPKTEFIADFVGAENIFDGESKVEEGIAKINIGNNVEIVGVSERPGKVKACIRPEEIIISKKPVKSSGRNLLRGEISEILDQGATVKLNVNVGREFSVTITKKSYQDMGLEVGEKVYLAFKASSVHVI